MKTKGPKKQQYFSFKTLISPNIDCLESFFGPGYVSTYNLKTDLRKIFIKAFSSQNLQVKFCFFVDFSYKIFTQNQL